jgi:hypothetical protein
VQEWIDWKLESASGMPLENISLTLVTTVLAKVRLVMTKESQFRA